ncbi:MAG: hypothetical protein MUO27_02650 [Sedimentisphaerales bacterium]|nr:hypothetical protein [Sedimentisphaerales bacterium]
MQKREKLKILFLCTGNSCRSQMAEGWARKLKSDTIEPHSAGTHPRKLDIYAVRVMAEGGRGYFKPTSQERMSQA